MKSLYFYFISIFFILSASSQTYEIGGMFGSTSFVGDVGSTKVFVAEDYFDTDKQSYGLLFRWNRSNRHSFRFSFMQIQTRGIDADSDILERQIRDLKFETTLREFSVGVEYTFWEWDLHDIKRPQIVPYLSTGISYFFTDHYARVGNELSKFGDLHGFSLPLTLGLKSTLGNRFVLSGEFSARYAFSDNLDGSNPEEFDDNNAFPSFGNPNSNDWYIFAGFSITYMFGRKPCYNCIL